VTGHFSRYPQTPGEKHHEKEKGSTIIDSMANEIVEEGTSNGNAEEKVRLKRAQTAELYADIRTASHPVLPSTASVTYMDEGAANIVYSLSIPPPYEDPERYQDVFPNSGKRPAWTLWDGKQAFHSSSRVNISFNQALNSSNIILVVFLSSPTLVTPFLHRNNLYPKSRADLVQANCYVYARNYHGQLHAL
jgi:hypothetical protein